VENVRPLSRVPGRARRDEPRPVVGDDDGPGHTNAAPRDDTGRHPRRRAVLAPDGGQGPSQARVHHRPRAGGQEPGLLRGRGEWSTMRRARKRWPRATRSPRTTGPSSVKVAVGWSSVWSELRTFPSLYALSDRRPRRSAVTSTARRASSDSSTDPTTRGVRPTAVLDPIPLPRTSSTR